MAEQSQRGALLRREGLYTSHLAGWRKQRAAGTLAAQKRGPKINPQAQELARLQRENAQLQVKLQRAELIIDAQKKLFELLEQLPPDGVENT